MKTDVTPQQKLRGRTKTFDYDKTLDIAIQRYWSKGPTRVSVNEICGSAGVSKPSLYREFTNEDGLMAASLERYSEKVLSRVLGLLDQDQDFRKVLDSLISYSLRPPAEASPAGCLFAKMRLDKDFLGPETQRVIEVLRETSVRAFAEWLRKAKDHQGLVLPGSVHTSAAYLDDQLNHLANRSASNENLEELREQAEIALAGFTSD